MFDIFGIASSIRKRFVDNFASRSNTTGSLGTATDGSLWNAVNGTVQVTSGAAVPTTTPAAAGAGSTYPMATVNMPTSDNIIKMAGTNDGSAAAIWVQSGTDWWMVNVEADQSIVANYSYAWQTLYYNYTVYAFTKSTFWTSTAGPFTSVFTGYAFGFSSTTTQAATTFTRFNSGTKSTFKSTAGGVTTAYGTYAFNFGGGGVFAQAYSQGASSFSSYSSAGLDSFSPYFSTTSTYSFASSFTTVKNEYLKIRRSASDVVSIITSQLISTSQSVASLLVSIVGNVITAKAYSDTNFVTQIGTDLVYTATGATITTQYGISLAPSTNYQSTIISTAVDITRG
jgi:hypothetical protein